MKTVFLNVELFEDIYMSQRDGFLLWFLYSLKQASRQWFLQLGQVITYFGFNKTGQYIYLKISGNKFIFLLLYDDDIIFASSDIWILHNRKQNFISVFPNSRSWLNISCLWIESFKDRSREWSGLFQISYTDSSLSYQANLSNWKAPTIKADDYSVF